MPTFKKIGKKGQEKWTVVFDLPGHSERKQKRLSGFDSRPNANLAYIAFMANYKPPSKAKRDLQFDVVYSEYSKVLRHIGKPNFFYAVDAAFRNHILPRFGERQISDIKAADITNWLIGLNETKLKFATKQNIRGHLSRFFSYCVENDITDLNPCAKALKLKNNELKQEMQVWSECEFKAFIAVVKDIKFRAFYSFLYLTGARRGEAMALRWNDLKGNIVKINKSLGYDNMNGGLAVTTPKNFFSNRDIIMPETLVKLLAELKEYYKKFEIYEENGYIFGNNRHLPPESIRRHLREYCQEAGVKVIRLHDLRHSHASFLISKGHDIVTISRRLGHADIEMTLNRYAHLMPNKQTELMDSLNLEI